MQSLDVGASFDGSRGNGKDAGRTAIRGDFDGREHAEMIMNRENTFDQCGADLLTCRKNNTQMSQCAEKPGTTQSTQMTTTASADAGCVQQAEVGAGSMEVEAGRIEEEERRMPMAISVGAESKKASNSIFISPWRLHDDIKPLPVMYVDLSLDDTALVYCLPTML